MRRRAQIVSRPAPVGGWNARDSLAMMAATDAVVMDNIFPEPKSVRLRKGYVAHGIGLGSVAVQTLIPYASGASEVLLAASDGKIFNVTNAGSGVTLASGYTDDRWSFVNFNGSVGLVNGADTPIKFNGSAISAMTITGAGLTGNTATLVGITSYRSRTYFWQESSQDFWYSSIDTLGGALTRFPLSRVGQFGGAIIAMGNWSQGGQAAEWGQGGSLEQFLVIVMSSGEIVVYRGSDPGDATDWALISVFKVGSPLGSRCLVKVAGDLIVMTVDGFVPMSAIMQAGHFAITSAVTDKIRQAVTDATREYGPNIGWEAVYYPRGNAVLFNIPINTSTYYQYVYSTAARSWCLYTSMNARCWAIFNDDLYFGGVGEVYQADSGSNDDGEQIAGYCLTSYSQVATSLVRTLALRPVVNGSGQITFAIGTAVDYRQATPSASVSFGTSGATWDSVDAFWDDYAVDWDEGGAPLAVAKWLPRTGVGYRLAIAFAAQTTESLEWISTDISFEPGQGMA